MANTPDDPTVDDDLLAADEAALNEQAPEVYDEADLERLTDAERAALTANYDDEPAAEPEPEPEDAPVPEPEPAAVPAAAQPPQAGPDLDAYKAALDAEKASLPAALSALQDRYDDGELTREELAAAQAAAVAEVGQRAAIEADNKRWADTCRVFVAANPGFLADAHRDGFNAEVEIVTADPRFAALSMDQQLALAAKRYAASVTDAEAAALTLAGAAAPQPAPKAAAAPAATPDGRTPKPLAPQPVPTLHNVPAETIDPNISNVAALAARIDRETDPEARERIMAALPDHLLDQVLSYGG